MKIRKLETRIWSEEMVSIYAFYSARYQHLHTDTDTELAQWFAEEDFESKIVSEIRESGFRVYGDFERK